MISSYGNIDFIYKTDYETISNTKVYSFEYNNQYSKDILTKVTKDGIIYGVKANTFVFSYSPGVILNYEKPGDYGGPFKNYGGGWLWGIDHCYDPRTNHSDAVQAYSITFGNNKGVYFGDDKYYYWEKWKSQNGGGK